MSKLLTRSEVDTAIQRRMANEAPDENVRLEAIDTAMQELYAEFDIETGRRKMTITLTPDGTEFDLEDEVEDFKSALSLKYSDTGKTVVKFDQVDVDVLDAHVSQSRGINEFAIYYDNGDLKLKVNNASGETASQDFVLAYNTYYNSRSSAGVVQESPTTAEGDELLMPRRFKSLVVIKAMLYCMPIALGVDSEIAMRRLEKEYNIEKLKLDVDIAKKPRTKSRQLNLRQMW